jgi:hypothetical protein
VVEVEARWHEVLPERWPVVPAPQPDELLSSFLHRIAVANGLAACRFGELFGFGEGLWSPRLDLHLPAALRQFLAQRTGLKDVEIAAMTIAVEWHPLVLALRCPAGRSREARRRAAWLQYCPACLAGDATPYFRWRWRVATTMVCRRHGGRLLDRCPRCHAALAPFAQRSVIAQHVCVACGFDLRGARAQRPAPSLRYAARLIDDLCRFEARAGLLRRSGLSKRLLRLPWLFEPQRRRKLTQLSSLARVGCLAQAQAGLHHRLADYLGDDPDPAIAVRRRPIIMAGGSAGLVSLCARLLRRREEARRKAIARAEPKIDLSRLVAAYRAVWARRRPSA